MVEMESWSWTFPPGDHDKAETSLISSLSRFHNTPIPDADIVRVGRQCLAGIKVMNIGSIGRALETELTTALHAETDQKVALGLTSRVAGMLVNGMADRKEIGELLTPLTDGLKDIRSLPTVDAKAILDFVGASKSPFPGLALLACEGLRTANRTCRTGSDLWFAGGAMSEGCLGALESARGGSVVNASCVRLVGDLSSALLAIESADRQNGSAVLLVIESNRVTGLPDVTGTELKKELWLEALSRYEVKHVRRGGKQGGGRAGVSVVHLREIRNAESPGLEVRAGPSPKITAEPKAAEKLFCAGKRLFMSDVRYRSAEPLRKAAEMCHGEARLLYAWLQLWGCGVAKDQKAAMSSFSEAVNAGNVYGKAALALCMACGWGCAKNPKDGAKLAEEAARAGCGLGMGVWGRYLMNAWGVAEDEAQAVAWYRKGADEAEPYAMGCLGGAVYCGEGATERKAEGLAWLLKGAELGDVVAMLGCASRMSGDECHRWWRAAAVNGDEAARKQCIRLKISLET